MLSLKHLVFWALFGFRPKCGCGKRSTGQQNITAGGYLVGVLMSCDEHMAEGDVRYFDRQGPS